MLPQSTSPFAAGSDLTVTINLSQGHHHTLVIPESLSIRDSTSTIHVLLSQLDFNRYNDKFIRQFTLLIENKTEVTNFDFKYLTQNEIDSISTLSDDVMQNTGVFTANGNSLTVRPGCRSTTPSCSNVGGKTGYTLIKFLAVTIPSGASFNQYLMAWGSWDL